MAYTNADALADLEHSKDVLEPAAAKRAAALLVRINNASADAECSDSEVHAFFSEVTGGTAPAAPKPSFWKFWNR